MGQCGYEQDKSDAGGAKSAVGLTSLEELGGKMHLTLQPRAFEPQNTQSPKFADVRCDVNTALKT